MSVGWGFVGTGGIARSVAEALDLVPGGRLVAVASREQARAESFAAEHGAQAGYGSVDELLADPAVDVVYVATTHPQHHAPARAALLAGTPVLVEKPLTVTRAATADLVALAAERSVFLMEAYWTRFLPGTAALLEQIAAGAVGDVKAVHADLGFPAGESLRRFHDPEIGGGSLLDLGPYPVGLAVTLLGAAQQVAAVGTLTESGVDEQIAIAARFAGGAVAALSTTMVAHATGRGWIEGTAGRIEIDAPVHGVPRFTVTSERGGESTTTVHEHAVAHGHRFMLEHVHDCLAQGLAESPLVPWQWSLDVAHVFEEALTQVGVTRNAEAL